MSATLTPSPQEFLADQSFRMLIGEDFVGADDHRGDLLQTVDPSTGRPLTKVPEATADDVARAVEAARRAQPMWEEMGLRGRAKCFARLSELLTEHRERLAMLDAIDGGMPIRAMRVDVDIC